MFSSIIKIYASRSDISAAEWNRENNTFCMYSANNYVTRHINLFRENKAGIEETNTTFSESSDILHVLYYTLSSLEYFYSCLGPVA